MHIRKKWWALLLLVIMRNYKLKQVWNINLLMILQNLIETSMLSQMQIIKICTIIFSTQSTSFVFINCKEFWYVIVERILVCLMSWILTLVSKPWLMILMSFGQLNLFLEFIYLIFMFLINSWDDNFVPIFGLPYCVWCHIFIYF